MHSTWTAVLSGDTPRLYPVQPLCFTLIADCEEALRICRVGCQMPYLLAMLVGSYNLESIGVRVELQHLNLLQATHR